MEKQGTGTRDKGQGESGVRLATLLWRWGIGQGVIDPWRPVG